RLSRNVLEEASRELKAGITGMNTEASSQKFNAVALHWLLGLVLLARGDEDAALAELEREIEGEKSGHLYARECCANTAYAIGALRLRQGKKAEAQQAFAQTLERVPNHRLVLMVLTAQSLSRMAGGLGPSVAKEGTFDEQ